MGSLERILLVDDDPDIRLIARLALRGGGWEVEAVASGEAALLAVATRRPDLVLLDVMMDGLSGEDLMQQLPKGLPVILLTARARSDLDPRLVEAATAVIQKPFDPTSLAEQVQSGWDRTVGAVTTSARLRAAAP